MYIVHGGSRYLKTGGKVEGGWGGGGSRVLWPPDFLKSLQILPALDPALMNTYNVRFANKIFPEIQFWS